MAVQQTMSDASESSGGQDSRDLYSLSVLPTNSQPAEKRIDSDGQSLDVQEIFYTIQGEGPYAGRPAVFIRLAGCVLQCPLCDTDYTSKRQMMTVVDIVTNARRIFDEYVGGGLFTEMMLAVITGGEPLRQPCGPLVRALVDKGFKVQIESNGIVTDRTLTDETAISDYEIVCSPKVGIHKELRSHIKALKYVVKAGMVDEKDGLPTRALDLNTRPERPWEGYRGLIYVQPCDEGDPEKNKANMETAVQSCMRFGYILGIQMHKIAGLR